MALSRSEESTAVVPTVGPKRARLEARAVAFLVDSIMLASFITVFVAIALFQLWVRTDFGEVDPPDSAFSTILAIILAIPFAWGAFNVWLYLWRGQSVGQYVTGIKVVRTDGTAPNLGGTVVRLLVLNPLLFHPFLAVLWALVAAIATSVTVSEVVLAATVTMILLSLASPFVALAAATFDKERRALHDRVTGTVVVPAS
jgi:uncharacterized RDD family membrane protein YckC